VKNLLKCPSCSEVVGQLDDEGNLIILRYGSDKRRSTIIAGKSLVIVCGVCGEVVFYRNEHKRRNETDI
jgi:hypothetical protein